MGAGESAGGAGSASSLQKLPRARPGRLEKKAAPGRGETKLLQLAAQEPRLHYYSVSLSSSSPRNLFPSLPSFSFCRGRRCIRSAEGSSLVSRLLPSPTAFLLPVSTREVLPAAARTGSERSGVEAAQAFCVLRFAPAAARLPPRCTGWPPLRGQRMPAAHHQESAVRSPGSG